MRKLFALILAVMLILCMVVTASAVTPTIKVPSVKIPTVKVPEVKVSDSFWDKWFAEHPIVIPGEKDVKYATIFNVTATE